MPRTPRLVPLVAILLLCLPILAACAGDDPEDDTDTSLLPMTLAEWLFPPEVSHATGDPLGIAHLSITPMKPGGNDLVLHLTNLDGTPLDIGDPSLAWRPLSPDAETAAADIAPVDGERATWAVDGLALDDGWYAFDVALNRDGAPVATATLYALLPDPSVYGHDAIETPDSDPGAKALYERALTAYGGWETARWRENLGSGSDVLVVTQYAVDGTDPDRARMAMTSLYAGAFRPDEDGAEPRIRRDLGRRIAIGDRWWTFADGQWSEASGLPVAGFEERADIYTGATSIQPAGTETIDGIETQIITFHLPQKGGQAEAWFAWWIDPESGDVVRMAMIAEAHFMIWDFSDVNAPLEILPPVPSAATPAASPVAPPAGSQDPALNRPETTA